MGANPRAGGDVSSDRRRAPTRTLEFASAASTTLADLATWRPVEEGVGEFLDPSLRSRSRRGRPSRRPRRPTRASVRSMIGVRHSSGRGSHPAAREEVAVTLEHLVVYGGIVVGIWLIGIVTLLATARQRRSVLHLDMQSRTRRTQESGTRGSAVRGWVAPTTPSGTADQSLATAGQRNC